MDAARVLVVDDDRFFREGIRDALGAAGIACDEAETGAAALKAAEDPRLGVVVLDVTLPDVGALEVLEAIRELRPHVRVIALSTHAEQETVIDALRAGACDYLAKPLHDEELVLSVRRALSGYATETGWQGLRDRLGILEVRLRELEGKDGTEAARTAVQIAADVLGATKSSILLLDEDGRELRACAAIGDVPPEAMVPVAPEEGVAGVVFAGREALVVGDVGADARFDGRVSRDRYDTRSFAAAPIEASDRVIGVLCATDREDGGAFDEDALALLKLVARHVGPRLVEAPPAAEAEGAADADGDARLASEICEAMVTEIEPERLLEAALQPIARTLPASPVSIYLMDPETGDLALEGQSLAAGPRDRRSLPRDQGLTGVVLQTGCIVAAERPAADPRFVAEVDTPEDGSAGPLLCLPLRLRGKVLGVARAFPQDGAGASARTGEVVAAALSAAIRNVLLYRSLLESIDDLAEARRQQQAAAQQPGP